MAMERVELTRDTDAVQIPIGTSVTLEKGTEVYLMQSLGGSFTIQAPSYGGLFRIAGRDGDAIGKEPVAEPVDAAIAAGGDLESQIWSVLKTCYDPEIPVNIVELGLVYDLKIDPQPDGKSKVFVKMTLTAPGCGMGGVIAHDAKTRIESFPAVAEADVEVVFEPPWNQQMMSEAAKLELGLL